MKASCVQRRTGQTLSGILSLVDLNNALRSSYSAAERDACRVPFSVWSHDSMRCVLRWVHLQNDVYTTRVQPNAAWARISLLVCLFVCEYLVLITYIYIYIIRTSYFGSCKHDSMRRAACACIYRGLYTRLFATVELCRVNWRQQKKITPKNARRTPQVKHVRPTRQCEAFSVATKYLLFIRISKDTHRSERLFGAEHQQFRL